MTELLITARASEQKPNYKKTAPALLERCRKFYQDPENEKAFQEWKAGKEGKHESKSGQMDPADGHTAKRVYHNDRSRPAHNMPGMVRL